MLSLDAIKLPESTIVKQGFIFKKGGNGLFFKWKLKFAKIVFQKDHFALLIYDKRDELEAPKHSISFKKATIQNAEPSKRLKKAGVPQYPFTIVSEARKYHLSAQSRSEQEEWMQAVDQCISGPKHSAKPIANQMMKIKRDDDIQSTYSNDSYAISVYSSRVNEHETHSMTSAFETLVSDKSCCNHSLSVRNQC